MENLHTPGEWYAKDGQIYPQETGKTLALIPYFDSEDKEQEANGKLIAAAPELLEALIHAYSHMVINKEYQGRVILETIRSAIQKATDLQP